MKVIWKQIFPKDLIFVNRCLDMGPKLSKTLYSEIGKSITVDKVFALCEVGASQEKLFHFNEGSIFSDKIIKENLLEDYLRTKTNSVFIFEDYVLNRCSMASLETDLSLIFHDQNIYLYFDPISSRCPLETYIQHGGWYPFICYILNQTPKTIIKQFPHELTDQEILYLVHEIQEVIIGAYDEESFIKISLIKK